MSAFCFVVVSTDFGISLTEVGALALSSPRGVWTQPSALPCASLLLTTENTDSVSLPHRMLVGIRDNSARLVACGRSVTPAKHRSLRRTLLM